MFSPQLNVLIYHFDCSSSDIASASAGLHICHIWIMKEHVIENKYFIAKDGDIFGCWINEECLCMLYHVTYLRLCTAMYCGLRNSLQEGKLVICTNHQHINRNMK